MNDIGNIMRTRRLSLNLTLEDVGKYVGVEKSTVKKWENGFISNMKRDKIALLSEILQVSPLTFIYGSLILDQKEQNTNDFDLTIHEKRLVIAYRAHPEMQPAVDTILGLEQEMKKENLA